MMEVTNHRLVISKDTKFLLWNMITLNDSMSVGMVIGDVCYTSISLKAKSGYSTMLPTLA
jgi:hypothetical protein